MKVIGTQLGTGFEFDFPADVPESQASMYWTRWEWSAAMDASTDILQMLSLNRSTAPAEYLTGQAVEFMLGRREIGNIQGSTNAGTANLLINVGPTSYGRIPPIFEQRLRTLGEWMRLNGEAIYATRPWVYQNDTFDGNVWYVCHFV